MTAVRMPQEKRKMRYYTRFFIFMGDCPIPQDNYSRKGNRAFPQRTHICQRFGLWEEGEFAALYNSLKPLK